MLPPLTVLKIANESEGVSAYKNVPLNKFNDHVVRLSVMRESFYWHYHPNSDETFLVIEGVLCIELEDQTFEVSAGELFTIPANVKHRTRPKGDRSVNLSFELSEIRTVKCQSGS